MVVLPMELEPQPAPLLLHGYQFNDWLCDRFWAEYEIQFWTLTWNLLRDLIR